MRTRRERRAELVLSPIERVSATKINDSIISKFEDEFEFVG